MAVGTSIADCLLGPSSPLKYHWYERSYPLLVAPEAVAAAVASPGGVWLAGQLESLLTRRPGQVQTRPATLAAAFWALALVRRMGPPPSSLLPVRLIIDLLEEKDGKCPPLRLYHILVVFLIFALKVRVVIDGDHDSIFISRWK